MIRVSSHKLEHLTLEVLGPLFQIGGIFVSLAAVWIVTIEVIGGIALTFADLGVEALGSGLSLFVVGTLFIKTIEAVAEEEDRSYLLPFVATASSSTSISPSVVPTVSGCASCGYKNHNGGFFCVACNSPLWPKGTPIGEPPARSVVERRIRRVIAVQKAKHFSLLAIIAIAISAPLATNLATGYIAVSDSSLRTEVGFIGSAIGQPNGTLLLNVYLWSDGVKQYLYLSSPAYIVTIGDMPKSFTYCSGGLFDIGGHMTPCNIMVSGVKDAELNGSTIGLTVSGIASYFIYRQQITRSASIICNQSCIQEGVADTVSTTIA